MIALHSLVIELGLTQMLEVEINASELLEYLDDMFLGYYKHVICHSKKYGHTISKSLRQLLTLSTTNTHTHVCVYEKQRCSPHKITKKTVEFDTLLKSLLCCVLQHIFFRVPKKV